MSAYCVLAWPQVCPFLQGPVGQRPWHPSYKAATRGAAPLPLLQTALQTCSKFSLHPHPAQKESRTEWGSRELRSKTGDSASGWEALSQLECQPRATPSWDKRKCAPLAWCHLSVIPKIGRGTGRRANQAPVGQKPGLRNWKPASMILITSGTPQWIIKQIHVFMPLVNKYLWSVSKYKLLC